MIRVETTKTEAKAAIGTLYFLRVFFFIFPLISWSCVDVNVKLGALPTFTKSVFSNELFVNLINPMVTLSCAPALYTLAFKALYALERTLFSLTFSKISLSFTRPHNPSEHIKSVSLFLN